MYQGTTPSYLLTITKYDLTDASVFVTLESGNRQFTLENDRLDISCETVEGEPVTTIEFGFSQEETFRLPTGTMKCQVRWVTEAGDAYTTDVANLTVNGVLLKKVIEYGEGE